MPRHDPVPARPDYARAAAAWGRFKRMMKWMALASAAAALLALLYLKLSGGPLPIHMVIATLAGVGLTVLVGTALMGLVFLSNNSGHDEAVANRNNEDE